jgi:hypothetical protein
MGRMKIIGSIKEKIGVEMENILVHHFICGKIFMFLSRRKPTQLPFSKNTQVIGKLSKNTD